MKKRIVVGVFAIFMILASVSVWAGGAQEGKAATAAGKPKLQFASWMVAEASGGEKLIPERIKVWADRKGVDVEVIPVAWEDTPDKITLQIQAKNAPDIFTIESLWLGKFAKMPGGVEDLSKYMTPDFTSTLVPAYKGGELEGKMAGLVWNPNPWVLVYNKELAKKAGVSGKPVNFDDFIKQGRAIAALGNGVYGIGLQLGMDEYAADCFHILMWQMGGDMLDKSGKPLASSAGTVNTVKLVKQLVDEKVVPFGEEVRNLRTMFAQGKIGFFFEGPWIAGVLDGEGMSRDAWDVTTWPGDVQPASHILCLSQNSKNKDLAFDLMKFIVSDEATTKPYFQSTGLMPVVQSHYNDPQYNSPYCKTFLSQMSHLKNPNVWGSQKKFEIEMAFMEGIQKVLLGQGSADSVMKEVDGKITTIISQ